MVLVDGSIRAAVVVASDVVAVVVVVSYTM